MQNHEEKTGNEQKITLASIQSKAHDHKYYRKLNEGKKLGSFPDLKNEIVEKKKL
jgi:hypothetical protein